MRVHIVSHTHWDREWYQPHGRFRQRLVALVDELIDTPPGDGASFLLDGQGIVLEDYLAVRPERRAELGALLRDGRLEAGPWFVLADELIPGGEALVRNLLAGRRTLRTMRADSPPILYCPDSFGHPAMLPALARGFGFEAVLLWRGYGGPRWPEGDSAWWRSPDSSRVLLLHLPPDGYEFGANLSADPADAIARWDRLRAVLEPRARLGVVLVQNGADHHARQAAPREAVAALIAAASPATVTASSLGQFARDALAAARSVDLPEVRDELRDSYGYTWTLQGTFGTRTAQKRTNAHIERLLVRDAEPWAALVRARAGTSQRALVDAAWRSLLECHPHDTLCGCSIDAVARAADVRWAEAGAQARGIRADALDALVGHDHDAAHARPEAWAPAVIVRNRAPRTRRGIARLRIETFLAHVPVGPAGAGHTPVLPPVLPPVSLPVPYQVLAERVAHARIESPRHYPDDDLVVVRDVLAFVGSVPGYGLVPVPLDAPADRSRGPATAPLPSPAQATTERLWNGEVAFDVAGLVAIECHRDAGDLYTPAIRDAAPPAVVTSTRVVADGPLRAAVALDWTVPSAGDDEPSLVTTTLSLDAGEPFLRIEVAGEHRGRDQRIRLRVRTGVADARVFADAAFGPVERLPVRASEDEAAREMPPRTAPLHRYVSLHGTDRGATLYSDGLGEYEVLADGDVAVTLVRAVGELSRGDLPERPGHAGWPSPTPDAQCRGPFAAGFALMHHAAQRDASLIDAIERTADGVLLPLTGDTRRNLVNRPSTVDGVTLEGAGLAFSAMKESEDGGWTVVRCSNLLDEAVQGAWRFGWPVGEGRRARLDETPIEPVEVVDDAVHFTAAPREIVTLLVR